MLVQCTEPCVAVVLQGCHSGVTGELRLCCGGATVVLQCCHSSFSVLVRWSNLCNLPRQFHEALVAEASAVWCEALQLLCQTAAVRELQLDVQVPCASVCVRVCE
jgi:hypothetical protein